MKKSRQDLLNPGSSLSLLELLLVERAFVLAFLGGGFFGVAFLTVVFAGLFFCAFDDLLVIFLGGELFEDLDDDRLERLLGDDRDDDRDGFRLRFLPYS